MAAVAEGSPHLPHQPHHPLNHHGFCAYTRNVFPHVRHIGPAQVLPKEIRNQAMNPNRNYVQLTPAVIRALTVPAGKKETTHWESPGFGLRHRASGSLNPIVQYDRGGVAKRISVGPHLNLRGTDRELERAMHAARQEARKQQARIRLGADPVIEKAGARVAATETFGRLLFARPGSAADADDGYLAHLRERVRPRSLREMRRHLTAYAAPLHSRPVAALATDIRGLAALVATIKAKNGLTAAACAKATWSGYFRWLITEGFIEGANPISALAAIEGANRSRERTPDIDELCEIWNALEGDEAYSDIIRLLVLTGCRRSEIGGLRWDEVYLDEAKLVLPATRVKNAKERVVYLNRPALEILQARSLLRTDGRPYVFSRGPAGFQGWSHPKADLAGRINAARQAAGRPAMENWVLHDLRRATSTILAGQLHVAPHIVERLIGHTQGETIKVVRNPALARIYNRAQYEPEQRSALEAWAAYLATAINGREPGKVVALSTRPR
jgi:integrase